MSALPPIPPDIARIAAPLLFGGIWNWCLYGVLVVQLYVYGYNFPEDKTFLKLLGMQTILPPPPLFSDGYYIVYTIFFLESLQTALSGADLYYWFISGFGDLGHLTNPYASAFDGPMIESLVSLSVQYFFAYRIWVLSLKESWWLCLIICLCSTIDAAAAFTGSVYTHVRGKFASGKALMSMAMTWLIGNTMADILITAAMLYYLSRRRRDGGGTFGDNALVRVVGLTIETNIMTTTVGIVSLLMVAIFPQENWFVCPTALIGKLYSNTLLVSLNNRISIREAAATRRVTIVRSSAVISPVTPRSGGDTMIKGLPVVYKTRSLASNEGHERVVVGEWRGFSLRLWITPRLAGVA
ncbi:hypothetical protein BJV78DRAFT_1360982 [Lactifluus subvellereus]|nr:hypothetical protein BJV78DRAFT_1360982 [Lactifluus subvellereus]